MAAEPEEPTAVKPTRWEVELEFVQCLANPMYVHFLGQSKYLESPEFLNYLAYLEYWRNPQNAKFLVYPNCLHMLKLLQQPSFREEICKAEVAKTIMDEYYARWAETQPVPPELDTSAAQSVAPVFPQADDHASIERPS